MSATFFPKGSNFCDFLFAYLGEEAHETLPKREPLLQEQILSMKNWPPQGGGGNNARIATLKVYSFTLIKGFTFCHFNCSDERKMGDSLKCSR